MIQKKITIFNILLLVSFDLFVLIYGAISSNLYTGFIDLLRIVSLIFLVGLIVKTNDDHVKNILSILLILFAVMTALSALLYLTVYNYLPATFGILALVLSVGYLASGVYIHRIRLTGKTTN